MALLQFAGVVMEKVQQLAAAGDALSTHSTCVFHSFRKEKEKVTCDLLSLETACLDTGSEFLSLSEQRSRSLLPRPAWQSVVVNTAGAPVF